VTSVPARLTSNAAAEPRRMSREECLEGAGKAVPDLVGPDLRVLLVGINPSNCSGAAGFHFATPLNRLWPVLHRAGFTDRQLRPDQTDVLRALGIGITNLVNRATVRADEVDRVELRSDADRVCLMVRSLRPGAVAILGLTALSDGIRAASDRGRSTAWESRGLAAVGSAEPKRPQHALHDGATRPPVRRIQPRPLP
jgi:double-stranded uracil-DNA glycosylase